MMTILRTALIGSAVFLTGVPTGAHAFSLGELFGAGQQRPGASQSSQAAPSRGPVTLVQADDSAYRIGKMEEEIRTLNGKIEELGFQLLQMQEQVRQMQQDNEYRFQALEGGAPAAGGQGAPGAQGGGQQAAPGGTGKRSDAAPVTEPDTSVAAADTGLPGVEPGVTASTTAQTSPGLGTPPRTLGTLTVDENGVPEGQSVAPPPPAVESAPAAPAAPTQSASLTTPEDIYSSAYNHVLAGDYKLAQQGFRDYLDIYPDGPQAADAAFWLGESEYSQGSFNEAAKTFLDAHKKFPKSEKAPEMLLKLGMSLAALDNRDTACATYREVLKRYPKASSAVKTKVANEQRRSGC